ncbi:MAG: polysaccharide export protein [Acidobacteriia bacterium]|nr:polysaccharide export protein [Terriglobia bacterium]
MKTVAKCTVLLLAGTLAPVAFVQGAFGQRTSGQTSEQTRNNMPALPRSVPASAVGYDYVIGADDTLHISVWKEPDLTVSLPVRPDGKISLPLLNDVSAAGLTPMQLKTSITDKLKMYIADPRVTVIVTAMNSRRIFVTGEVVHTGAMPLLPNMTMLQALSAAGFTQFANLKNIYLLRTENGRHVKLPFNYKEVVKGNHPEQNIMLKPGDTVVVP